MLLLDADAVIASALAMASNSGLVQTMLIGPSTESRHSGEYFVDFTPDSSGEHRMLPIEYCHSLLTLKTGRRSSLSVTDEQCGTLQLTSRGRKSLCHSINHSGTPKFNVCHCAMTLSNGAQCRALPDSGGRWASVNVGERRRLTQMWPPSGTESH